MKPLDTLPNSLTTIDRWAAAADEGRMPSLHDERRRWVGRFVAGYKGALLLGLAACGAFGVFSFLLMVPGWLSAAQAISLCGLGFFCGAMALVVPAQYKAGPWPTPERRDLQQQLQRDRAAWQRGQPAH